MKYENGAPTEDSVGTRGIYGWVFKIREQDAPAPKRLLVVEPRCRVCRDPDIRRLANELLSWRGAPMLMGDKCHTVTYADVLGRLGAINAALPEGKRITYSSLWVHAKRHYDANAAVGWWCNRLERELRAALAGA